MAVFRLRDGSVRALGGICPHRGGPLADGLTDGAVVVCPLHGYTFDLITGEETANGGAPVCAYVATVCADGAVRVAVRGDLTRLRDTRDRAVAEGPPAL